MHASALLAGFEKLYTQFILQVLVDLTQSHEEEVADKMQWHVEVGMDASSQARFLRVPLS